MQESPKLADLPLLPRGETGPVFAEPWQAQAFAVVVSSRKPAKSPKGMGGAPRCRAARSRVTRRARHGAALLRPLADGARAPARREALDRLGGQALDGETIREDDYHRRENQLKVER